MRIHIGNIAPVLALEIGELEERLRSFGELQSPISLHKKAVLDTYYGYCDLEISDEKFTALKKALNGVRFKQSLLSIQEARPKWEWKPETEPMQPNPSQAKRQKAHLNEIGVYKGKYRTHPRTPEDLKEITLRLKFPNGIHKVRTHRQRLWGYEKKLPQNLVYEFSEGEWRDLTGRPVEIAVRDEHDRDTRVLEKLNTGYLSDSEFEDFKDQMDQGYDGEEYYNDDMEVVSGKPALAQPIGANDSDTDEEFYAQPNPALEPAPEPAPEPVPENTTEALRNVLAPSSGFTLFGPADVQEEEEAAAPEPVPEPVYEAPKPRHGLFFMHSDSPFLSTQAQILKLTRSFDPEAWQRAFYENRGDWNRQLRKRRREEHRTMRKKGIVVK